MTSTSLSYFFTIHSSFFILHHSPHGFQNSHRKRYRHPDAHYESPESLSPAELESVKDLTQAASPASKGLMKCYEKGGKLGSQAACLIRDTMKVTGIPGKLQPPTAALFSIDPSNPEAGGTAHTIRVCRNAQIPTVFQNDWKTWLTLLS